MDEHRQSISARVTSRDKSALVEVDGLGAMTGLWLRTRTLKLGGDVLAKPIADTSGAAVRVCVDRQNFLVTDFNRRMQTLNETSLTCRDGTTTTNC